MSELAGSAGSQTPLVGAAKRPSIVPNNVNYITAATLSACLDRIPQQGSSESESSSYSCSVTSSPTEGQLSSNLSPFSETESSSEETNVSSAKMVTVPKGEQTVDVNGIGAGSKAPLLKGAGKSDCSVRVVSIEECERDVPVASLSDENSGKLPTVINVN